jgi:nucleoside-diphosphate-sugar epimerase
MKGRLLITGASGFVGRVLCSQLRSSERLLTCTSRVQQSSNFVVIDEVSGGTNWSVALRECQYVIHLAARVHVMNDTATDPLAEFRATNVDGTLNLARQAAAAEVRRFVYVSSIGVNGMETPMSKAFSEADIPKPHNAYSLSKWEAEEGLARIADDTGMEVVIVRPPLVYGHGAPGNFGSLMRAVQRGIPLPLGAVHNLRSLVALDNLVDFIMVCIDHPKAANQTFMVSDGEDISTTQLIQRLAQAAGVPSRLIPVPVWALQAGARLLGKGDAVQRLCGNLQVDISKTRNLLGWVPPVSVDEGLRRAVAPLLKPA